MKAKVRYTILEIYCDIENDEPDISTERLLAMVADEASRELKTHIDESDICEALVNSDEIMKYIQWTLK